MASLPCHEKGSEDAHEPCPKGADSERHCYCSGDFVRSRRVISLGPLGLVSCVMRWKFWWDSDADDGTRASPEVGSRGPMG